MKTNKTLLSILAITVIFSLGLTSTYAFGGNGQGSGKGQGQGQGQGMNKGDSSQKGNGSGKNSKEHNGGDMITNIEKQDVDSTEIDLLKKQYEEEMMANELYSSFYDMYGVQTFANIAESEAQHMEAVKVLLDRYDISIPTSYDHIQSLYEDLKDKGALGLKDALEVGISIEIVDIDDIVTAIKSSDNNDIKIVLTNIGGASYNHMRGFVKALSNNNLTTDIDYSDYLSIDDINTKGTIKVKLAEKLESEGVELPEQASSKSIQENCDNEDKDSKGNKGQQKSSETNKSQKGKNQSNSNSKNQYK